MISNIKTILLTSKTANKSTAKLYYHLLRSLGMNPKTMTAAELLNGMSSRKLPSFDSVSRMSRTVRNKV